MRTEKVYISENGTPLKMGSGVIVAGEILAADCETALIDALEEFKAYSVPELLDMLDLNLSELVEYVERKKRSLSAGTFFGGYNGK